MVRRVDPLRHPDGAAGQRLGGRPARKVTGPRLGAQFHPEVDRSQLRRWIDSPGGRQAVVDAGKDPDALLEETARQEPAARSRAGALVGEYLEYTGRLAG